MATKRNLKPVKKKRGRPVGSTILKDDPATIKQVGSLGETQCTLSEAGAVLGVCQATFENFLGRHKKVREAWDLGKENGKASLRRNQVKNALTNTPMQIWLGKQVLGQRDNLDLNAKVNMSHEEALDQLDD